MDGLLAAQTSAFRLALNKFPSTLAAVGTLLTLLLTAAPRRSTSQSVRRRALPEAPTRFGYSAPHHANLCRRVGDCIATSIRSRSMAIALRSRVMPVPVRPRSIAVRSATALAAQPSPPPRGSQRLCSSNSLTAALMRWLTK